MRNIFCSFRFVAATACGSLVGFDTASAANAGPAPPPASIVSRKIWDLSRIADRPKSRMELTDLIGFEDHWYCVTLPPPRR
jgi:hypothetical protein